MFRGIRESIANHLICWLMEHTHCWVGVLYTACNQYYPEETKAIYRLWLKDGQEKEKLDEE